MITPSKPSNIYTKHITDNEIIGIAMTQEIAVPLTTQNEVGVVNKGPHHRSINKKLKFDLFVTLASLMLQGSGLKTQSHLLIFTTGLLQCHQDILEYLQYVLATKERQ